MEEHHPNSQPLSPEDQALLATIRPRLQQRLMQGGLNAEEMRRLVQGLRRRPELGEPLLNMLQEAAEQVPGAAIINLRWD